MVLSGQSSAPAPAPTLSNSNNNNVSSVSSEFPAQLYFPMTCRSTLLSRLHLDLQSQQHPSTVHNNSSSTNMSNSVENHMNNNNSSLSNCVSPTSNQSAAVSGRTSPTSLMSPQQQQQQIHNGPATNANQKQQQQQIPSGALSQANAAADPASESMSTLKTIAQEVVNRTNVNLVPTPPMNQQQQQQQSYVMDTTSLDTSSTATGQNGLNANINNLINATNMSSNTNMKSTGTNEALIPPLLGVAPLGPSPLQKDHQVQVSLTSDRRLIDCLIETFPRFSSK